MVYWILLQGVVGFLKNHASTPRRATHHQMFTGTVEEMGTVLDLEDRDDMVVWDGSVRKGTVLTLRGELVKQGVYLGCNICVSGVRSMAIELYPEENILKVCLFPGALKNTYLGCLKPGDKVNLERARDISDESSGHCVEGNVDYWGKITKRWENQGSLFFRVKAPTDLLKYVVPQGHVAVDGTRSTVFDVNPVRGWFTFCTNMKNNLLPMNVGDPVNVEVVGKQSGGVLVGLIPRLEQLEADYRKLQARTTRLEARKEDLERRFQSQKKTDRSFSNLENFRRTPKESVSNGSWRQVTANKQHGKESGRAKEDWLRQQESKNNAEGLKAATRDKASGQGAQQANEDWLRKQLKNKNTIGRPEPHKHMVSGQEAQRVNEGWLRQQQRKKDSKCSPKPHSSVLTGQQSEQVNEDWLQQQQRKSEELHQEVVDGQETQSTSKDGQRKQQKTSNWSQQGVKKPTKASTSQGPETDMVSGPAEAQNANREGCRQQKSKDHKVRLSGPVAQKINDEWRRQQRKDQERYASVKRVRNEDSSTVNGVGADKSLFRESASKGHEKFRTMVGGSHAKKINDEWLRHTGMDEFEEKFGDPEGVQDATVVDQRKDPGVAGRSGRVTLTPDLDKFTQEEFNVYAKGGPPPNQRPGRNLDIQDATLVDPEEPEEDA